MTRHRVMRYDRGVKRRLVPADRLPPLSESFVDGDVSWWYRATGGVPVPRPSLDGDRTADVAIVGGGLTGLWTAYYLRRTRPDLAVVVVEKEFAGFGASGRNGGWLTAEVPGQLGRFAETHGVAGAAAMQRAMTDAVDEVIAVAAEEGIEADIRKDGVLHVATNAAQLARLRCENEELLRYGLGPGDLVEMGATELAERVRVAGALGATWSPHCARVQPARLTRGVAAAAERHGAVIVEGTTVERIEPGVVHTDRGTVRAPVVVRALEGFTADLPGRRRDWLPMSSSMIVTAPLPEAAWDEIGWRGAELLGDGAHGFAYAQRTEDGRIALGGRAVPYRFGSRHDRRGETLGRTVDQLRAMLARLFPAASAAPVEHAWAGVLGVPRDWCATVGLDRETGLGWAGGYVGHGLTSTNLAGRTLTDLVLGHDTDLTALPWVGRRVRRWEPEPARWIAVRGLYRAYGAADAREDARSDPAGTGRTSRIARVADRVTGR